LNSIDFKIFEEASKNLSLYAFEESASFEVNSAIRMNPLLTFPITFCENEKFQKKKKVKNSNILFIVS